RLAEHRVRTSESPHQAVERRVADASRQPQRQPVAEVAFHPIALPGSAGLVHLGSRQVKYGAGASGGSSGYSPSRISSLSPTSISSRDLRMRPTQVSGRVPRTMISPTSSMGRSPGE